MPGACKFSSAKIHICNYSVCCGSLRLDNTPQEPYRETAIF